MTYDKCPKCGGVYATHSNQGYGYFVFDPDPNGGFLDALDALHKINEKHNDFFKMKEEMEYWRAHAKICMICGYIHGQASPEQMKTWGIGPEKNCEM